MTDLFNRLDQDFAKMFGSQSKTDQATQSKKHNNPNSNTKDNSRNQSADSNQSPPSTRR